MSATRARVEAAIADSATCAAPRPGELAPHWRRNGFATWLFQPAATGLVSRRRRRRPGAAGADAGRAVARCTGAGPNAAGRADACWLPIAPGLTPHGLRHTLQDADGGAGHAGDTHGRADGSRGRSVQARYSHVTPGMTGELARRADGAVGGGPGRGAGNCSPRSPVAVLDRLLREREGDDPDLSDKIVSQNSPRRSRWTATGR